VRAFRIQSFLELKKYITMDTTSVVTGLIVILAVIVPIVITRISFNKKRQKIKKDFLSYGKEHELNIAECELWSHYAIGIDRVANKILYLNFAKNDEKAVIVNLNTIRWCEIQNIMRTVSITKESISVLERLELQLIQKGKDAVPVLLEFFNSGHHAQPHNEIEIANKWEKLISSVIKKKQNSD
jgi:hypothetical protein